MELVNAEPENRCRESADGQIPGGRHIYRPQSIQGQLPFYN